MHARLFSLFVVLVMSCFKGMTQSATEVVRMADQKMRGTSSQAEMVIRIVRPSWSREMNLKTWILGSDYAMILLLSPPREKGIVFLKRKKEVWNWMPALERIIKLPPSMMSQSWMGTDFTNDDLVRESSAVEDYFHRFVSDTLIAGHECYVIEFRPKPGTAVVWGKVLAGIDKKDFIELYTEFYDEDGILISSMTASDIKVMDGRMIPAKFEMIPADKPFQKTQLIYKSIMFNRKIDPAFFSIENMKRIN